MARPNGTRLTGQWKDFLRVLEPSAFERRLRREVGRATRLNALYVLKMIRRRITDRAYVANSPLTLAAKAPKTKPLANTGNLFGAINDLIVSDYLAFVGIRFGMKNKEGGDWVNIASKLHDGFTQTVTPAMRRAVFAKARKNAQGARTLEQMAGSSEGPKKVWVYPARPFIKDVVEDPSVQIVLHNNWAEATARALFGTR